jgi:RNA polymerase sigma-70 factor (ECF subfamily)
MSRFLDIKLGDECLQGAARGDRAAQRALYDQIAGPMSALIRRVVRDRSAADDLFQDSMMAVLRHLPAYRGEAPLGVWVRQVTLRQCLMHLRSPWQRTRSALHAVMGSSDDAGSSRSSEISGVTDIAAQTVDPPLAELLDLERALARLSDVARTVLWLHDVEGLTHAEIATTFARTPSFSKSQLARAHALLRAQLSEPARSPVALVRTSIAAQGQVP